MKFADKIKEARKEKDLAIALMLEDEKGFDEFLKAVQQSLIDERKNNDRPRNTRVIYRKVFKSKS